MLNNTISSVKFLREGVLLIAVAIALFAFSARAGRSQSGPVGSAICTPKNGSFNCNICLIAIFKSTSCGTGGERCWSTSCPSSPNPIFSTCAYQTGSNCKQTKLQTFTCINPLTNKPASCNSWRGSCVTGGACSAANCVGKPTSTGSGSGYSSWSVCS